jgi:polyketide synthase PksM
MSVLMKNDYVVRQAIDGDLPRLVELEVLCAQAGRASRQQIRARLKKYAEGQLVVEYAGQVMGVLYSQRIAGTDALAGRGAADVHQLHKAAGPVAQVLALNVDPRAPAGVADALLGRMLEDCRRAPDVERMVGIVADPALAWHVAHGAAIVGPAAGYRPADAGSGTLVSYTIRRHLFVLSAASAERLQAYAARVVQWLDTPPSGITLADAIHTWQAARTPMKARLAILVTGLDDLRHKLTRWLAQDAADGTWSGVARLTSAQAEAAQQRVAAACACADWAQLGELWASGSDVDWRSVRAAAPAQPRRISVPTYPFARERHWIEAPAADTDAVREPTVPEVAGENVAPAPGAAAAHLFVSPAWEPAPVSGHDGAGPALPVGQHHVALCEMADVDAAQLAQALRGAHCTHLVPAPPSGVGERYAAYALACFEKVKAILAARPRERVLLQLVVSNQPEPSLLVGLSGLLKSASDENPHFIGQVVVTNGRAPATLAERLRFEQERLDNGVVLYVRGARHILRWRPAPGNGAAADAGVVFRDDGVYLVTGGLGGLGVLFVREILARAPRATIVLTGRAEPAGDKAQQFERLARQVARQEGAAIEYHRLDLDDREQVARLVAGIVGRHGRLNGVLHCAGMTRDNLVVNKSADEFLQVLAPKVRGTLNLDDATLDAGLDWFMLFSSAASVFGNAGQADYAAANGFMDQFAAYRNRLVDGKERTGHTLALNWPLWQDGGMAMGPAALASLHRTTGLVPLSTATGLRIFHDSLAARCGQAMVLEGDGDKIRAMVANAPLTARVHAARRAHPAVDAARLEDETCKRMRQLFADATRRAVAKIDVDEELMVYGIDSIIIGNLNLALAKVFGDISKTLFFEYKTLAEVTAYFVRVYPAECAAWTGLDGQAAVTSAPGMPQAVQEPAVPAAPPAPAAAADEPIAIIGISGIYPQAADLDQFWANLQAGRDCIGEIPAERWRLDGFYEPDVERAVEQGRSYSKWGGFIEQFADFDPLFFNISPREAINMDPQERLFLQECWRALEDAGYTRADLKNKYGRRVGVFAGITKPGYNLYALHAPRADEPFLPYTSFSSAANRVSYFLDIGGPSMPVDTMCSSSLVAIHEACEHIRRGECELAFAGGVNLYLHPYTYKWLCSHRMLSRDGACRSFGVGSNGFVPGEGVGTVLLKPLSRAIADRDHIHGVILATHVNHGGRTNGYTVPSPRAQADLVRRAIDKAGIRAADIGYIEAHGTGTALGDPIEIAGLQQAFAADGGAPGSCRIGSAKSNIGHLEAAAGIAGLTKVLLQMKHRQLAPSLHAEELNPNIAFDRTPFRVNTRLAAWDAPAAGRRVAGVSSFGAAGANAHVLVQDHPAPDAASDAPRDEKAVVVLSARGAAQLGQRARDLLRFIQAADQPPDLAALAYTLQVGREAMAQRLCILAGSIGDLADKLQAWLAGATDVADLYQGQAADGGDGLRLFGGDEDFRETLDKWIARRKLASLAELWARGMDIEWDKLYGASHPPRLALPTYPFEKNRLWVDAVVDTGPARGAGAAVLHPMVHANTSDFSCQRYRSVFSGDETFLRDHQVRGEKILPAVAYLEMVRTAMTLAAGGPAQGSVLELRNTAWPRPLAVSGSAEVDIALHPGQADGQVEFEIRAGARVLHCQGQAAFVQARPGTPLDVEALKAALNEGVEDGADIYDNFRSMGVDFGGAHRAVERVWRGRGEVLAELRLPAVARHDASGYCLHPSLMDGALQASMSLMDDAVRRSRRPFLPFALDLLRVFAPCTGAMFAWLRRAPGAADGAGLVGFDVDLVDGDGRICAQMHGFTSRILDAEEAPRESAEPAQLHGLAPVWNRVTPPAAAAEARVLLVGGDAAAFAWVRASYPDARRLDLPAHAAVDTLAAQLDAQPFDHLLWVAPDVEPGADGIAAAQEAGVLAVFRLAKALLALDYAHRKLRWTLVVRGTQAVVPGDRIAPAHAAIHGLAGSLGNEYPDWEVRVLDADSLAAPAAAQCLAWTGNGGRGVLALRGGEWFRQGLARVAAMPEPAAPYRQRGVYVVIGGAGGIGQAWSRFMIEQYDAKLVWIGRRLLDAGIAAATEALGCCGTVPLYISADATDADALRAARDRILRTYPAIHGVVHSAIDLQDRSVALMDEPTFRAGLAAKLEVSVNVDQVFGGLDLDCMLFFSSLISFTTGAGQANYAAGCTFKDSFARAMAQRRPYPVKVMNWGYWGNVGVVAGAFYNRRMELMGIASIEVPEAMQALQRFAGSAWPQMALVKTLDTGVIDTIALAETVACYPERAAALLPQVADAVRATFAARTAPQLRQDLLGEGTRALAGDILASTLASLGPQPVTGVDGRWLDTSRQYVRDLACRVMPLTEAWAAWEVDKRGWLANPNLGAQVALLEACLRALPDILTGRRRATDVMFPDSSMALVEGVYKGHALADHANDVLGAALVAGIERRLACDKGARIRILEIGAGTGGTTARILPALARFAGSIDEYCYTDLSKAFLMHAEEHYRPRLPGLRTALFDVSQPLAPQGLPADRYDFLLATNVLHATRDIRETLRNAKALLKRHGVLLVNEMCGWSLFSHLTFGLLEGWWLYEDEALRLPGSPGLAPENWQAALEQEGFEAVSFLAADLHDLGQQVIAASSNGQVRQRSAALPAEDAVPSAAPALPALPGLPTLPAHGAAHPAASLREQCIAYLQGVVAGTLKMDVAQVAPGRPLTDFGLDSILVVGLTNQLRKVFPGIANTLFFEAQNVAALADYLLEHKREHVDALFAGASAPAPATAPAHALVRPIRTARPCAVQPAPAGGVFDVAIVGVSGRYPQASNLDEFWRNLADGRNCVTEVPADRWDWKAWFDPEKGKQGKTYTRWGGFLRDIDCFDPLFFRISPKEAKLMDPQERLFLETCYHAIEDAGYTPDTLGAIDRIGVFAGVMNARYNPQPLYYSIANRVSFALNFQGPSMAVDTACSSSLAAIHLALESLYSGLSECAIAGGVNLIIDPVHYLELSSLTMLSEGRECRSFGDGADGFVDAEGVGAVVLKPLASAERDGDHIYGVIKASAVNAGGRTNGYTVPNPVAQAAVVGKALQRAGVDAADISYIEAHGTGTALGDPIEIAGLSRAFAHFTQQRQFCAIGSLKSNIGHCESAAGIAALTKVLLQFKHRQLVPSLHADVSNPEIDFAATPFRLQRTLQDWPRPRRDAGGAQTEIPRLAGISSFGAGGANAHMVVQEYVAAAPPAAPASAQVVVPLSARTAEQLAHKARELLDFIRREEPDLAALAYTLQVGREALEERMAVLAASPAELEERIHACLRGEAGTGCAWRGRVRRGHEATGPVVDESAAGLAQAWSRGVAVNWRQLHQGGRPRRIGLPVYPFARERYWRERTGSVHAGAGAAARDVLHPLLHRNVSDIRQQRYRSDFGGGEFFVAQLGTGKVVPPLVYLEMARAAVEDARKPVPEAVRSRQTLELFDVAWAEPMTPEPGRQLFVALFAQDDDRLGYEIYSVGEHMDEIIHCQGQALLSAAPAPAPLDLARLAAQMRAQSPGLSLGDGQLLAELAMPAVLADDPDAAHAGLVLHPALMDAALQAAAGLLGPGIEPALPWALASVRVLGACRGGMFAWVRRAGGPASARLDIDLCDREGRIRVQLRGLAYGAEVPAEVPAAPSAAVTDGGIVLAAPDAHGFAQSAPARPPQISLAMD